MLKRPLRLYCVYLKAELFICADGTRCCGTLNTVEPLSRRFHAGFTPVSHCKREQRVSGAEAVRAEQEQRAPIALSHLYARFTLQAWAARERHRSSTYAEQEQRAPIALSHL